MILKFEDADEVNKCLLKAIEILINLREKTKDWQEHYGVERGVEKKKWELRADNLLADLKRREKIK